MTLALHPTTALVFIWGQTPMGPHLPVTARKTCGVCRYELIAGWCSRCDLEENGVLV